MTSHTKFTVLVVVAVVAMLAGGSLVYFKDTTPPQVTLTPAQGAVGPNTQFTLAAEDPSGLRLMSVTLEKDGTTLPLCGETPAGKPASAKLAFTLGDAIKGIKDGPVTLKVLAVDGSMHRLNKGNAADLAFTLTLDRTKPRIALTSMQHNLNRGGCGAVAYTLNEPVHESGVRVGDHFFPGHELAPGSWACLFAFPWDMELKDFHPVLEAEDMAGNRRERGFAFHANDREFRHDTLNIPDSFLEAKMPQFEQDYPDETSLLGVYLKVNNETRKQDREAMLALGADTADKPLWSGPFQRLPNAANRAQFADHRTYRYQGEVVDHQTHLGIDLASVRNAQVPAANAGRVVRASENGIYGENVVLDHGMGLMTMYAHLSQIDVAVGDAVAKGQIIGRTGVTGLAGGDHLHYGVFLAGVAVNPVEWWDPHWIKNNVKDRLGM
ncbi:M23 family metallopeptidase [Desulfocurvus sp. DL9XJH121]